MVQKIGRKSGEDLLVPPLPPHSLTSPHPPCSCASNNRKIKYSPFLIFKSFFSSSDNHKCVSSSLRCHLVPPQPGLKALIFGVFFIIRCKIQNVHKNWWKPTSCVRQQKLYNKEHDSLNRLLCKAGLEVCVRCVCRLSHGVMTFVILQKLKLH